MPSTGHWPPRNTGRSRRRKLLYGATGVVFLIILYNFPLTSIRLSNRPPVGSDGPFKNASEKNLATTDGAVITPGSSGEASAVGTATGAGRRAALLESVELKPNPVETTTVASAIRPSRVAAMFAVKTPAPSPLSFWHAVEKEEEERKESERDALAEAREIKSLRPCDRVALSNHHMKLHLHEQGGSSGDSAWAVGYDFEPHSDEPFHGDLCRARPLPGRPKSLDVDFGCPLGCKVVDTLPFCAMDSVLGTEDEGATSDFPVPCRVSSTRLTRVRRAAEEARTKEAEAREAQRRRDRAAAQREAEAVEKRRMEKIKQRREKASLGRRRQKTDAGGVNDEAVEEEDADSAPAPDSPSVITPASSKNLTLHTLDAMMLAESLARASGLSSEMAMAFAAPGFSNSSTPSSLPADNDGGANSTLEEWRDRSFYICLDSGESYGAAWFGTRASVFRRSVGPGPREHMETAGSLGLPPTNAPLKTVWEPRIFSRCNAIFDALCFFSRFCSWKGGHS